MKEEEFLNALPAVWLVFHDTYLSHNNAPRSSSDQREKLLVDLLKDFLRTKINDFSTNQVYSRLTLMQLTNIYKLLVLWSEDLNFINEIRNTHGKDFKDSKVRKLAHKFLQRINNFDDLTIIPSGLIVAERTQCHESINIAILKKRYNFIDWIHVDPGSDYHQHSATIVGEKSNSFLEIKEINPKDITEDWLYLLLGLKSDVPGGFHYKDSSLYECLLSHLNGKTIFQSKDDNDFFITYSHSSPVHTWQVVDQAFHYMLKHFLENSYQEIYCRLIIDFKLFLIEKTFAVFKMKSLSGDQLQQCHFLLQEMCRIIAKQVLDQGNDQQIDYSFQLIRELKNTLEHHCIQEEKQVCLTSRLDEVNILSLSFVAPCIKNFTYSPNNTTIPNLHIDPVFSKPSKADDIIDYLLKFKENFINKLVASKNINDTLLLSYGIEVFFIDYLANTDILSKSRKSSFSKNDDDLAEALIELAGIFYCCQDHLINKILINETYLPQFFSKNVIIQFFVYAAVAALNLCNKNIGPLLSLYNLDITISPSQTLNSIIPHLVIDDNQWLSVLLEVQEFFELDKNKKTLFSSENFEGSQISIVIKNDADETNVDVHFAYKLLQRYEKEYQRFVDDYVDLKDEKLNQKWYKLTYTDTYLPLLYCLLKKVAHLAKVSLIGFFSCTNSNALCTKWYLCEKHYYNRLRHYWYCTVKVIFQINSSPINIKCISNELTSYLIRPCDSLYQKFVIRKEDISKNHTHFLENEIVADQHNKPPTLDSIRYMYLGSLQSEPWIKLERLLIAIKDQKLGFFCKKESILIKQTLFEISFLIKNINKQCSALQLNVIHNPNLIHALGLLFIQKAKAMQYQLTQHHAIGDILDVVISLLTFYPSSYKADFIKGIEEFYYLLKEIVRNPPNHLSDNILLHLNTYLIIVFKVLPDFLETETLTMLKALLTIQNYKAKGIFLNNYWLLQVHVTCLTLSSQIEYYLKLDNSLLNSLMIIVIPQWDQTSLWEKDPNGFLFTCNDYSIIPLKGGIYFRNQPIIGLPDKITSNSTFREYFGQISFSVIPSSQVLESQKVPCYLSINYVPQTRLTLIENTLLIEEFIDNEFQRYISPRELLGHSNYSQLLYHLPHNHQILTHWLRNDQILLIKDRKKQIIYEWNLNNNYIFSLQHQEFIVPWEKVKALNFKSWLTRIESSDYIEITAKHCYSNETSDINNISAIHLPRLSLSFDNRENKFFSRQVHGYSLAEIQHLNTLHGFSNYLVLEKKEPHLTFQRIKIIIPHRPVTPTGYFYTKNVSANLNTVMNPPYFVYNYDPKTGLLKGQHIRSRLYLSFLYCCLASFDDYDLSHINSYHLARENLDLCWNDQPYDSVELNIIAQLLDQNKMRNFHSHRIALYLKVVSLLSSSLRLGFLYMDNESEENKSRSRELLNQSFQQLGYLYLQNKSAIFSRIKLSHEEEADFLQHCNFSNYYRLNFENISSIALSVSTKKYYKRHYQQLFEKQGLNNTNFYQIFIENIDNFSFVYDTKGLNFSYGIDGILIDRFRLVHFITLYNIAKKSTISLEKYRYLLHHLVFRAKINYRTFPENLVMMLARVLLLVAESKDYFIESPCWFGKTISSVELFNRHITDLQLFKSFPAFEWTWYDKQKYDTTEKAEEAEKLARKAYEQENQNIWKYFNHFHLDNQGVPNYLPENPHNFSLKYETYINFKSIIKRDIVRKLFAIAAYNDAMYQFFVSILKKCDQLKYGSSMGWIITPFINNTISLTFMPEKRNPQPQIEPINLEEYSSPQKPLIEFHEFFTVNLQSTETKDFLFESEISQTVEGYQTKFYSELKNSWLSYLNEKNPSYFWLNLQSIDELERFLIKKYNEIYICAQKTWNHIDMQFKQKPNTKLDNYFALRWYSGEVKHYNKGDILKLLIEPHKIEKFNPDCIMKKDDIIQNLLNYVIYEINSDKIVRILDFIYQYKQASNEPEKYSILQFLVKTLQENISQESYRFPHWFLFQLENEVIVRDNQRELILNMLNQTEKTMYQLNMGEGKSSVILPLLSYNLANSEQLLRIIVLPSLLRTSKDYLRQSFSGLIIKHVYTFPFHRDTDISSGNIKSILKMLETCQREGQILIVSPEQVLSLQLRLRELMLENQEQKGANNIFNWQNYRERAERNILAYDDLDVEETENLLEKQNQRLKSCLINQGYIDSNNCILKMPPRGLGRKLFARFKESINDSTFREWSCLKAAYRELLYNSTVGYTDSTEKLNLLNKINLFKIINLLDESDEILRHGTELNYTIGDKFVFSGGELRWSIPQFFLEIIFCDQKLREIILKGKPDGFTVYNEHSNLHGGVPFIKFLNKFYYEKEIKPLLIEKFFIKISRTLAKYKIEVDDNIVEGDGNSSLRCYVSGQLSMSAEKMMISFLKNKGTLLDKILIAKGWLSHGILYHVLNAKYRVQYGLNLNFTNTIPGITPKRIAIPFWGKDMPSPRSEFSHPDVMLGFTNISYLYEGLSQEQLKATFIRLKSKFSNQVADSILKKWAEVSRSWIQAQINYQETDFPPLILSSFQNLDIEDEQCLAKVHSYLSGNYLAIFFYLNQFVLIEEAMQYRFKIMANAHSLVGYEAALGFSGTDDRKVTMPYQVKSLRSQTQEGTNGKLLSVLSQKRNSDYYSLEAEDTKTLLTELCSYIEKQPQCHALIDAGALITGWSNYEVASFLLDNLPSKYLGILYFSDKGNSLTVLSQGNKTLPIQDCYIDKKFIFAYLDDIHTRGTDIKLPLNAHAILTIGMDMQKDKLMQAAMRLRQLAQKQSVSLWSTNAVTLAIAKDNSIDKKKINSLEIIKWTTKNTLEHINSDLFAVAIRKINFQFLKIAEFWLKMAPVNLSSLVKFCKDEELFHLEDFYALSPQYEDLAKCLYGIVDKRIQNFYKDLEDELKKKNLEDSTFYKNIFDESNKNNFLKELYAIREEAAAYLQKGYVHCALDNDQEKENEVEIIEEQQVVVSIEKRKPYLEKIWDVRLILQNNFISTAEKLEIVMPLKYITDFILEPSLKDIIWNHNIYMTTNYIHTVECTVTESLDNYLRLVDVVLIHRTKNSNGDEDSKLIILSGKEAANIKSACYNKLINSENFLVHIKDINGTTQLPTSSIISKKEEKLLTIIKLFFGECHYTSKKEVQQLAKYLGRLYPQFLTHSVIKTCEDIEISEKCSEKIYDILIKNGYLDFSGGMTEKLLNILSQKNIEDCPILQLPNEYLKYNKYVFNKLYKIYTKLIVRPSASLNDVYNTLWQWVGTRKRLKEYVGSELESILNSEFQIKFPI